MSFRDLGLGDALIAALDEKGYQTPTPIQQQAIPIVLGGSDLVGLAQTGTGKTGGFILPMIEILAAGRAKIRMPRSLVLAPTRELAAQVAANFDAYGKNHKLTKALIVGGESMADQMRLLERGVDVLIATPGRLLDVFERGGILMTDIKILVIDEADRMLDMGFIPDIEKICSRIPARRQTLLFSATMPPEIKKLTDKFLRDPKSVSVNPPSSASATIDHRLMPLSKDRKRDALMRILSQEEVLNAFVFCNRKRDVADLGTFLKKRGFAAGMLHGDMPQPQRTAMLADFKSNEVRFLVCSDVAARGLDIKGVSHVINYDVPFNPEDYVHRIGRTGRAGMEGNAITFATPEDDDLVAAIEAVIGKEIPAVENAGSIHPRGRQNTEGGSGKKPDAPRDRDDRSRQSGQRDNRGNRGPDRGRDRDRPPSSRPALQPVRPVPARGGNAPERQRAPADDTATEQGFGDDTPAFFR